MNTANAVPDVLKDRRALGATGLGLADVAGKLAAFLITPYLANRMGAAEFGALNLYVSVTQILMFLISLGGAGLLAVEYVRNGYTSARRMRAANLRISLCVATILLLTSVTVSLLKPSLVPITSGILIVIVSYMQALNVLELSYYRGAQSYKLAIICQSAFAGLSVLLTVLSFEFTSPSANNRLLSVALAGAVAQALYALHLRRKQYARAEKPLRREYSRSIMRFGASIFLHQASIWIRASVDRFIITIYFGLAAVGSYSLAITLSTALSILFYAVSQQMQPFFYRLLRNRDFAGFRRLQALFVLAVIAVSLPYLLILEVCFDWIFAAEYANAKSLLPVLLVAAAMQSVYYVYTHAAFYERRGGYISAVTVTALIVHLCGLALLLLSDRLVPTNTALIFLASSAVATIGMAGLSHRTVRELRNCRGDTRFHSESDAG